MGKRVTFSRSKRIRKNFFRNRTALVGGVVALIVIIISILAPWISPYDPLEQDPYSILISMNREHLLGTDDFGRDLLSRIIWGGRISLIVGVASVSIGLVVGTIMGLIAAYVGNRVESIIMRAVDVLMCFPDLILAIGIMAVLGSNLFNLIITIGIVNIPGFARLAHGAVLSVKERDYVTAAQSQGAKLHRIIFLHILPNIFGEILVVGTLWVGAAIRLEANLAFIGLGVSPPTPTWGNIISGGVDVLVNAPLISISSGFAIFVTILAFNMFGDGIRDAIDPRLRGI
jgi:peptide/nickel transport system permease protein